MRFATHAVAAALGISSVVAAQSVAPAERTSFDTLVREVRLLRGAVERQTLIGLRSQVLASRLAMLQHQVVRAQDDADAVSQAFDTATAAQEQMRDSLGRLDAEMARVLHDPRRSELERDIAAHRAELSSREREVERLRGQRQSADQRLSAAQSAYRQAEASLAELEHQIAR